MTWRGEKTKKKKKKSGKKRRGRENKNMNPFSLFKMMS
jgi:hypothetical protein